MAGNRGFLRHPRLDALLEQGRAELNDARRLAIYAEALQIIREYAPIIMLRSGEAAVATSPWIRNMALSQCCITIGVLPFSYINLCPNHLFQLR